LLIARQLLSELKELDGSGIEYFVRPPMCPLTGSPYDFSQSDALIDRAIKSTDAWIAHGGLEKPNVRTQLSIHKHGNQKSAA
jgi:NTE family protein